MGGFGSTYEGLKRPGSEPGPAGLGGFGSTYEGLKQDVLRFIEREARGFGSTYEGLKPSSGDASPVRPAVLAVPMRA